MVVHSPPPRLNGTKHIKEALAEEKTERPKVLKLDHQDTVSNSLQTAIRESRLGQNMFVS